MSGSTGPGSTRNAFSTPVSGGSHIDARTSYSPIGSGYAHIRSADRRPKDERDASSGRMDSGTIEIRFVDDGVVWEARELPRCYLPVSGDFNDMTYDPVPGADGKTHHVLLDGMVTLFRDASDTYSPDVGDTPGTCHLPGESLPILPGRRFGEKKLHADITFIAPDTTVKTKARAGDGQGRQGLWSTRRKPELNPAKAASKRSLRAPDVKDFTPGEPLLGGTPGKSAAFPFLHERLSLNPNGNVLLFKSTVTGPFGKTLDEKTVRDYLELGGGAVTSGGATGDKCSLLAMGGSAGSPVKLWRYSYMVGIALLAEFVERISRGYQAMIINIKRNHAYNKANSAVIKKLWCLIQENPEVQSLLPTLHQQLEAAGPECMESICQTPCGGQPEVEPDPLEPPGGGGYTPQVTVLTGGGTVVMAPTGPFTPSASSIALPTTSSGPAGHGFVAAGGGTWWPHAAVGAVTSYVWYPISSGTPYVRNPATGGYTWAPGGSVTGPTGTPSDRRLKDNITKVGTLDRGFNLYKWDWSEEAIALGCGEYPCVGVVAQEVLKVDPEAITTWKGYLAVDYRRIW